MRKLAFVVPWYGKNIPGGAESELRGLVYHLREAGVQLEILTTCVRDFMSNWNKDYHKPKKTIEDGIIVRRFRVKKGNHQDFNRINEKLMAGVPITLNEEAVFNSEIINSTDLYAYMDKHKDEYDLFIFIPYMFGTTYNGINVCPEKSVLIPCLHDESYAYMKLFRERFSSLKGIIFHAKPESDLANKLYDLSKTHQAVLGEGVDTDLIGDAKRFRKKYNIDKPFILYAGRKDATKNVDTLIKYFTYYKHNNKDDLQLVMIGPGDLPVNANIKDDVHDLGFVPRQDKYDAYTASLALCQPSKNESFSLVIMESWLAYRPVLVHEDCSVTANFAKESNGGFYFANYYEFELQVKYLLEHLETADIMGMQGRKYVIDNFSWDVIVKKYIHFFNTCIKK